MADDLFPTLRVSDVTRQHMIDELARELRYRRRSYPYLVERGKLNCVTADLRIKILVAVKQAIQQQPKNGEHNGNEEKTSGESITEFGGRQNRRSPAVADEGRTEHYSKSSKRQTNHLGRPV